MIFVMIGAPGSGKGTQGKILSEKLQIPHISIGDILRNLSTNGSKNSSLIKSYINNGLLLPSDIVNSLVFEFLSDLDTSKGYILDGYPRSLEQAMYFEKFMSSDFKVFFFSIDEETVVKRILGRYSCIACGAIYNEYYLNPINLEICDKCGAKEFSRRSDDEIDAIRKRLELYYLETNDVIEYYSKKSNFITLDANQSPEKVTLQLQKALKFD